MSKKLENFKRNKLWYAICTSSLAMTWLMTTSVVQASDLQIYAVPKAGKKTLVMMLDTSGSMGRSYINEDYPNACGSYSQDTGGDASYSYTRNYCSVSYSSSSSSNYQKLRTRCYNPNLQPNGSDSGTASLKCYDRISRLQDGMFALLNSSDADVNVSGSNTQIKLSTTSIGLGNFSANGDGKTGQILVAAKPLGAVGSTQRNLLKSKIAGLSASNGTPSAHAMAEAASYLLGTTTYSEQTYTIRKDSYIKRVDRNSGAVRYSTCQQYRDSDIDVGSLWQSCRNNNSWSNWSSTDPGVGSAQQYYTDSDWSYVYTYYYTTFQYQVVNEDSGTLKSKGNDTTTNPDIVMDRTASNNALRYKSPLPAVENRASCDGQGIYFLSDGQPNSSSDSRALTLMQKALDTSGNTFSCSNDLPNTDNGSAWRCMGAFAKTLFNPATNPQNVSIKTAFVGFGKEFEADTITSSASQDTQNACKMSSRSYRDPLTGFLPADKCSPGGGRALAVNPPTAASSSATYKTPDGYNYDGGYGNGGFFQASSSSDVTNSVVEFIKNLGGATLEPLTTGQISVPYDALNPNNLSEYGYLRAIEPDPANNTLTWRGNLKKYSVVMTGTTNLGAFEGLSGGVIYNNDGTFSAGTKDRWNSSSYTDGGKVFLGGAYSKVPLPINGQLEESANGGISKYAYTQAFKIRNLFTDVASSTSTALTPSTGSTSGTALLQIPAKPTDGTDPYTSVSATATYVLNKFNASSGQAVLKDFPLNIKLKLLNYLGYSTDITQTTLPASLTTSDAPYLSMGGSIHSYPIQLTYSGTLDSSGNLTSARSQSILYGSMEGGLHIVNADTGAEQMVFVPAEVLSDSVKSKALVVGQSDSLAAPLQGMDGSWVADPTYHITSANGTSSVTARQMNVYGGMRMGGNSYYALDVLSPSSPKLLFKINNATTVSTIDSTGATITTTPFNRLGQTWSKPVLANVRYNGTITRVMIVGGGYDPCYEDPTFALVSTGNNSSCSTKTQAQGNAVYMINAKTGALIWSATYGTASGDGDKQYMKHSIVSRISTLDRDADGLIDHLYFGDLGGQVFRADLNNNASTGSGFGVRVVRLANLATNDTTNDNGNDYTGAKAPRFYEPPTVTIHDQGVKTFIAVGIASGNRSTPLDVFPTIGREGMSPASALTGQPVNNVYGILDYDFIKTNLITGTPTLETRNKTRTDLKKNPQVLGFGETVQAFFFPSTGTGKAGWYRSLSSKNTATIGVNSTEKADGAFRIKGGMKAFEEPLAITSNLLIPVYDPQGTGVVQQDQCKPRVVGETDWQRYCLPYGACVNADGSLNTNLERKSGFQTKTDCPAGATECNDNIVGSGIRGLSLVPIQDTSAGSCGKLTMSGNTQGTGEWQCTSRLVQTRWYERYR